MKGKHRHHEIGSKLIDKMFGQRLFSVIIMHRYNLPKRTMEAAFTTLLFRSPNQVSAG